MKITKESLNRRANESFVVSDEVFSNSILDMIHLLFIELSKLLEKENRFFGIVTSYMNSVQDVFDKIDETTNEDDYEVFGRAMYLFKPLIYKSYRKLRKRKVSPADCIIVIIKSLTEYLKSNEPIRYQKELKSLDKIITKLFDNIRNNGKNQKLTQLVEFVKYYREIGILGKYSLDKFSISDEESKYIKVPLSGTGVRLDDTIETKIEEISWTDE